MTTLNIRPFHGDYHSSMRRILKKKKKTALVAFTLYFMEELRACVYLGDHKIYHPAGTQ